MVTLSIRSADGSGGLESEESVVSGLAVTVSMTVGPGTGVGTDSVIVTVAVEVACARTPPRSPPRLDAMAAAPNVQAPVMTAAITATVSGWLKNAASAKEIETPHSVEDRTVVDATAGYGATLRSWSSLGGCRRCSPRLRCLAEVPPKCCPATAWPAGRVRPSPSPSSTSATAASARPYSSARWVLAGTPSLRLGGVRPIAIGAIP